MKLAKKILKIALAIFTVLLIGAYVLFINFSSPKSDSELLEAFENDFYKPIISKKSYVNFEYRILAMQKEVDTTKTTIVFVHGSPGSLLNFKHYLADSLLNVNTNMISYDRVGYNFEDKHLAQKSIEFEAKLLSDLTKNLNLSKTIIVGYSYGGPIALAVQKKYKKIVLLAPAVYSEVEPVPWLLNFYKWKATRWLLPKIWKSASEEKMTHKSELKKFENNWKTNVSEIVSIHGKADGIVPYENSLFLHNQLPVMQFKLIAIKDAGHGLVWSHFNLIKKELLKLVN